MAVVQLCVSNLFSKILTKSVLFYSMNSWLESPTYKRVGTLFVVQSKDDPAQNKSRTLGMERTSVVDVPTERGKWTFVEMLLYRKEKSKLF